MYKITKEMCVDFLKGRYKSKMLAVSMLSLVALAVLWSLIRNIVIVAIVAAVLMVLLSIYGITIKHKIENIHLTEFYLAEDVVRDFKKTV